MDIATYGFLGISIILIVLALLVTTSKKLVHSIIFLFGFIIMMAAMFIYLDAVFLGIAELIIYNGGIVLLLAIGISLMPDGNIDSKNIKYLVMIPIAVTAVLLFLAMVHAPGALTSPFALSGFGVYLFQNYGILLIILGITGVTALLSTIYILGVDN
ncbi:MAG: NADH-quinone oxidoreductase subunit J [Candidatus Parvarchaeota archaeon]|jgi:NADH-quinone oxidoreductase subunit J|nr:NADH-quinone oxidoreductase subunit J [Candidatus Parvarchaeota archaeon]MCL5018093.1 NADH-quinone oxidoreductase subunit J [Candidatus Parvarchaeota archaeon]